MRTFTRVLLAGLFFVMSAGYVHAQDSSAVRCLAENVAREAPDEPYNGKLAVATVIMNRMNARAFPKTVCAVVYQRNRVGCQFSWTCQKRPLRPIEPVIFQQAMAIAKDVLQGKRLPMIQNALYFHATRVSPRWSRDTDVRVVARIGAHIFYIPVKGT